jgi:hypothetical protein
VKLITISRILGRQGLIRNFNLSKIKNDLREDDEVTGGCICTNIERYYNIDERASHIIYNKKRYRALKV